MLKKTTHIKIAKALEFFWSLGILIPMSFETPLASWSTSRHKASKQSQHFLPLGGVEELRGYLVEIFVDRLGSWNGVALVMVEVCAIGLLNMELIVIGFSWRFRHVTDFCPLRLLPLLLHNMRTLPSLFPPSPTTTTSSSSCCCCLSRRSNVARRLLEVIDRNSIQVRAHMISTLAGGRAESDQTSLSCTLEILSDWQFVCIIPVPKRRNLPTPLVIVIHCVCGSVVENSKNPIERLDFECKGERKKENLRVGVWRLAVKKLGVKGGGVGAKRWKKLWRILRKSQRI